MGKSLYSLMLSDEVVAEVDRIAHKSGLTRSAQVNRILAQFASVTTPGERISNIFSCIESVFESSKDIVPMLSPNQSTVALRSCLNYKYRPSVRYEVEIFSVEEKRTCRISVLFRTKSEELLRRMTSFFLFWERLETDVRKTHEGVAEVEYELCDGRFSRSCFLSGHVQECGDETGKAISLYLGTFDEIMKGCLEGRYTEHDAEKIYVFRLCENSHII